MPGPEEPLKLYKYRSFDSDLARQSVENIILNNRLYWQSPSAFNDPFDCQPNFIFGETSVQRSAFARRAVRANQDGLTQRHMRRAKKRIIAQRPARYNQQMLSLAFAEWMKESAVACFSRIRDSELMWAHYAASHQGLCFEFTEIIPNFLAYDVQYCTERPVVNLTRWQYDQTFIEGLLTKSSAWSYEQEQRMIDYRKPPGYRLFPARALTGIILGARMPEDDRATIKALVAQRATNLPVLQAVANTAKFKLDIVDSD